MKRRRSSFFFLLLCSGAVHTTWSLTVITYSFLLLRFVLFFLVLPIGGCCFGGAGVAVGQAGSAAAKSLATTTINRCWRRSPASTLRATGASSRCWYSIVLASTLLYCN
jgi:hypothetical protein